MSNWIDKLFKDVVLRYHLPSDGPDWPGLEAIMNNERRKSFLIIGFAALIMAGLVAAYFLQANKAYVIDENKSLNMTSGNHTPQNANEKLFNEQKQIEINGKKEVKSINNNKSTDVSKPIITHYNIKEDKAVEQEISRVNDAKDNSIPPTPINKSDDTIKTLKIKKESLADSVTAETNSSKPVRNDSTHERSKKKPGIAVNRRPMPRRKFNVYASFSPSLLRSTDIITEDNKTHKSFSELRSKGEQMKDAFGFGFGIGYSPFNKLSIKTGYYFERRIETVNYHFIRNEVPLTWPDGEIINYFILSDSAAEKINYEGTNIYRYSGIPVSIHYKAFQFRKFSLGINFNGCFMKQSGFKGKTINKTYLTVEDLSAQNSSQLKSMLNAGFGLDFGFALSKNLILNITPDYQKQLSKNEKTSTPKQASLKICLNYFIF